MVGGKVIEVIVLPERNRVWVNVQDGKDECAIYVVRNTESLHVRAGDNIWWQGPNAYWTTKLYTKTWGTDTKIPRIGYSGVSRPKTFDELQNIIDELEERVSELEYENNQLRTNSGLL